MSSLVLFDIDGTLVLTGGAGLRAMNRACADIAGIENAVDGAALAGRTDWIILHDAMKKAGRALDDDLYAALRDRYVERLREEIQHAGRGPKGVMPGVRALLDALAARADVFLGLLTGNFERGARIKLEYFDLWRYFRCGAFGDDAADRNALVPFALDRAHGVGLGLVPSERVFVVGDTPHDIACALAVDAVPIAVATGSYSSDQLRASGADRVFEDLSDTGAFLRLMEEP